MRAGKPTKTPRRKMMRRAASMMGLLCLVITPVLAQDPVKVDSKHYTVEFENARVRVLRIHYGPHEKSVMHEHPAGVAVFLTDHHVKFTLPDGKTEESQDKSGETRWLAAGKHLAENLGDKPLELILVELKSRPRAARHAAAK